MISVIIPTYERTAKTRRAIVSVQNQIGLPAGDVEIVVVDDASPTPFTVEPETGPFAVRVVRMAANGGAAAARNFGVKSAAGDHIAFLDSDDVWLPDKLLRQSKRHAELVANGADPARLVITCGFFIANMANGTVEARFPIPAHSPDVFASGCWHCPGTTFFADRRVFELNGPMSTRLRRLEDLDWFLRFGLNGGVLETTETLIGAMIAPSGEAKYEVVREAVKLLRETYEAGQQEPSLSQAGAARLRAYCALELAVAAWSGSRFATALGHLAYSQWLVPRTRVALNRFWERQRVDDPSILKAFQDMAAGDEKPFCDNIAAA